MGYELLHVHRVYVLVILVAEAGSEFLEQRMLWRVVSDNVLEVGQFVSPLLLLHRGDSGGVFILVAVRFQFSIST